MKKLTNDDIVLMKRLSASKKNLEKIKADKTLTETEKLELFDEILKKQEKIFKTLEKSIIIRETQENIDKLTKLILTHYPKPEVTQIGAYQFSKLLITDVRFPDYLVNNLDFRKIQTILFEQGYFKNKTDFVFKKFDLPEDKHLF